MSTINDICMLDHSAIKCNANTLKVAKLPSVTFRCSNRSMHSFAIALGLNLQEFFQGCSKKLCQSFLQMALFISSLHP